ncbi:pyrroloquinoline quinone biosynthesis protein PqqB [Pseudomonas aeruginosa]|nr:pyrroloquinoline quinone biosynthesis protein PqqB [Pseudomonas aeruginosa]
MDQAQLHRPASRFRSDPLLRQPLIRSAPVFRGLPPARGADPCTSVFSVRRRRRLPPVELQLPQLSRVRDGSVAAQPRTQSSIALSDDGERWILCNASPDIRARSPPSRPSSRRVGRAIRRSARSSCSTARSTTPPACSACAKAARTKSGARRWSTRTSAKASRCSPCFPTGTAACATGRSPSMASLSPSRPVRACASPRSPAQQRAAVFPASRRPASGRQHRPVRRGPR